MHSQRAFQENRATRTRIQFLQPHEGFDQHASWKQDDCLLGLHLNVTAKVVTVVTTVDSGIGWLVPGMKSESNGHIHLNTAGSKRQRRT